LKPIADVNFERKKKQLLTKIQTLRLHHKDRLLKAVVRPNDRCVVTAAIATVCMAVGQLVRNAALWYGTS
jgi:hypothetical protein